MAEVLVGVFVVVAVALGVIALRLNSEIKKLRNRYSGVLDLDAERDSLAGQVMESRRNLDQLEAESAHRIATLQAEQEGIRTRFEEAHGRRIEAAQQHLEGIEAEATRRRIELESEYSSAHLRLGELRSEVSVLEENLEAISFGIYKPHFTFDSPEEYKATLERLRDQARSMVSDGRAANCSVDWRVGESRREGERMVKNQIKLMLRAFNGECEAALANVAWNNVAKMQERIKKSYDAINRMGAVLQIGISPVFLELKISEIQATHEYQEKRYQEKEEQRKIREQIREEERAQKEIDKALADSEQDQARFEKALAVAREEAMRATGAQLEKLTEQICRFEAKLDEARQKKERAMSRAQLTKSGFVYVISNVGSFGDGVMKIGMTRRLEPLDRINELGDASVPFPFDLHAMLYSDNAPELEYALHQLFTERQVNLVNRRREFFRDVHLEEIEDFVRQRGLSAQFVKHPEARQFRESLALREQGQAASEPPLTSIDYPDHLFDTADDLSE